MCKITLIFIFFYFIHSAYPANEKKLQSTIIPNNVTIGDTIILSVDYPDSLQLTPILPDKKYNFEISSYSYLPLSNYSNRINFIGAFYKTGKMIIPQIIFIDGLTGDTYISEQSAAQVNSILKNINEKPDKVIFGYESPMNKKNDYKIFLYAVVFFY